jgi:uncharacterized protein (DUF1015 family)
VAAAPYDTFSRTEAAAQIACYPHSFLRIDKPAALLPADVDEYAPEVYVKAREQLDLDFANGVFVPDSACKETVIAHEDVSAAKKDAAIAYGDVCGATQDVAQGATQDVAAAPNYYLYRLTQGAHAQTGIVACVAAVDYETGVVKQHENTRAHKRRDRINHIEALNAHTGPVLLTYKAQTTIDTIVATITQTTVPLFDFMAPDDVQHTVWRVGDSQTQTAIQDAFAAIDTLYIADGHHRAAAAVLVAKKKQTEQSHTAGADPEQSVPQSSATDPEQTAPQPSAASSNEAQHFLAAIFPDNQMRVLDYNRVVDYLANHTPAQLIERIAQIFAVTPVGNQPYQPKQRGEIGLYLDGTWYKLVIADDQRPADVVESMDIAILHSNLLAPILKIDDPRSDPHISYVGGARGLKELQERADKTGGCAFSLYPCSLDELFAVADAERLMPPKSTWFEPKPRSGLFIHKL